LWINHIIKRRQEQERNEEEEEEIMEIKEEDCSDGDEYEDLDLEIDEMKEGLAKKAAAINVD
jgi:hypothetical protein